MPDLRLPVPACRRHDRGAPRPKRGEGQWALGYPEPLNKNEQSKKDDDPLNVRARIENIYSKRGFASIDPADLRGRFRWMGLYTQRKPGLRRRQDRGARGGGARRRVLHDAGPHRRRAARRRRPSARSARSAPTSPATPPTSPTARTSSTTGSASRTSPRSGSGSRRPASTRIEACGDSPAAVPRLPRRRRRRGRDHRRHRGRSRRSSAATSATPSTPTCRASSRPRSPGTPATTWRPRPTTSRSSAPSTPSTAPASTSGSAAGCRPTRCSRQKLGVWIPLDEVADVWEGVASVFRDYGYRRLRSRARLKFLVADWGVEKFREVLETEYLDRAARRLTPRPGRPVGHRDHIGVHEQKDGRFYVGVAPTVGPGRPARC